MRNKLFNILLAFSLVFFSCENFFAGDQLRKELAEEIEIANAKEINVEINLRSSRTGTVTPSGISKVKKGVPFEIELSVKSGYEFSGDFNVFEKIGGRTKKIENSDEVVQFTEKSVYNAGVGSTNYIFEATVLVDDYQSLLFNPDISNPASLEAPKILDVNIDYRYGNEKNIRDYFDVQLFVECDSDPNNMVYTSFIDSWGDFLDGEWMGCMYEADIEDVGNGNYRMSTTVDLRDSWLTDGEEYKLILYVENDGNVRGAYEVEKPFVFQAYSKTKVQVYNTEDTLYDYMADAEGIHEAFIVDECARTEESLKNFVNDLKLVVLGIDEEGLGYNKDGTPVELKYGFCQDLTEIESLELNNIISEYSVYDFETEFEELLLKFQNVDEENSTWETLHSHFNQDPDCEYTFAQDVLNHHNDFERKAGRDPYEPLWDINTFDFDLRVTRDRSFFLERQKVYDVLEEYRNNAFKKKSIVKISLPENLDKKKDIYIKISSENGIDNQKYVIFTIPASPLVLGEKDSGSENLQIRFEETSRYGETYVYTYNSDLNKWFSDSNFMYIIINKKDAANYGYYVSSANEYEYCLEPYNPISRKFFLHTLDIRKYKSEQSNAGIKSFPSDASIDVYFNGLSSGRHTISLTLDREIYNQFEAVFINYGLYGMDRIDLSEDNVFSLSVETKELYSGDGKYRVDYSFSVFGVVNGKRYETKYTIKASDDRVIDNVSPGLDLEGVWDWEIFDMIITNISVDSTGNFITILGTPFDVGDNLPDMVPVDITIIKDDGSYNEIISAAGDKIKYLNIPVSHLENGTYSLSISFKDSKGNEENFPLIRFVINRESVSDKIKIIKTGEGRFSINAEEADAQKYALSYFDESENLWKPLETAGDVCAPSEYEKTGFFQLHLNNPDRKIKYNNNFKYHYLFHFPEEKVVEKDYQLWRNSIRINTDKPFFIHFLKSDTDWGKDLDAWEGHQSYSYSIGDKEIYKSYYEDLGCFEYTRKSYEEVKELSSPYTGTEINPCVIDGDYTVTPYVCQIPWNQLDKKYAAAVIIWADNKKDLILLDTSLR